jgi:hypothetical protein
VLRELLSLERMVDHNLDTLLGIEDIDTLLIDGIGD